MINWLLVMYVSGGVAVYIAISALVLGWYMAGIPSRPKPKMSRSYDHPGKEKYKIRFNIETNFYSWYCNDEFINWDKEFGDRWCGAWYYSVFWLFFIPVIPYRLMYSLSFYSSKKIIKTLDFQKEKLAELNKESVRMKTLIAQARIEAITEVESLDEIKLAH